MSKLDEIIYCDTGCGSNADPADGFGYCTCGAGKQVEQVKKLIKEEKIATLETALLKPYRSRLDASIRQQIQELRRSL